MTDDSVHADGTPAGDGPDNNPEKPNPRVGRRKMILGVAAGVGASVVAGADPAGAESPDAAAKDVVLSKANKATATTSISMAVEGDSAIKGIDTSTGNGGYGLYGASTNGTGIYGAITGDTSGHFAVEGSDASTGGGAGVGGFSTNGTGVQGTSTNGTGVSGIHKTGLGNGVLGTDNSGNTGSSGVYGTTNVGTGVEGDANGEDGLGVSGNAFGTGDIAFGVWALSASSYSLFVDGTSAFTQAMSKPGGSFKIDHPVDPGGKYLYHSFVESPDMMNVYNGTVTLDHKGQATVELPDWFEVLNRDYRYQLTAIGSPGPELHISREVKDGQFSIAGGKAGQTVSWQVTGIRQDAWANANRIPVEVDKPEEDHGRYLHPELVDGGEAITSLAKARDRAHRTRHATPT